MSKIRAACTIVSLNYLHFARTLFASFHRIHPDYEFHVLIVDHPRSGYTPSSESFHVHWVEDLGISDFASIAFKYDILELNTNVKPTFLLSLFKSGVDEVIYFDPDVYLFGSVDFLYAELSSHPIIVTPHGLSPAGEDELFLEQQFLSLGVFNLGFVAIDNCPEGKSFLSWWEERCLGLAYAEARTGLYVDQKWVTLAQCFFPGLFILRNCGCNVAYWNLYERKIAKVRGRYLVNDTEPLVFYHFSGFSLNNPTVISDKLKSKLLLESRPDLLEIYSQYRKSVLEHVVTGRYEDSYYYSTFSDGTAIPDIARRIYASLLERGEVSSKDNPFDKQGAYFRYVKSRRLVGKLNGKTSGPGGYRRDAASLSVANWMFRLALRVLGAGRYTLVLRYLSFLAILRNQWLVFPFDKEV